MKLYELSGVKRMSNLTPAQAVDLLKQEFAAGKTKLRPLGKGAMAVALTNGTDVFKFWYKDSAYERYANFCMSSDSPWLPKFKSKIRTLPGFVKIGDGSADIRYVKMELLQPFTGDGRVRLWDDPAVVKQIGGEGNNATTIENVFRWSAASKKPRGVTKWLLDDHRKKHGIDADLEQFMEQMTDEAKSLIEAVVSIAGMLQGDDHLDYGARNMAMRGDQPVILDPIVNDEDIGINGEFNDFLL